MTEQETDDPIEELADEQTEAATERPTAEPTTVALVPTALLTIRRDS